MELKAYFSNIHNVIIGHLEQAQSEIVAAVAWFTDRDIFEVLCKKARLGVKVSVAVIGDAINTGPGGLNFNRLESCGGKVTFLAPASRDERTMHHKFCVIDRCTVITGSYNWSQKARSNDENITVVSNQAEFAGKYLNTFNVLLARAVAAPRATADADAVRRRLEMIRNLVLLGEQEDVSTHLHKLRLVAEVLEIQQIIAALDAGEYKNALEAIGVYLKKATALVVAGAPDVPLLRFQLETLELRLESLSDEKGDLERRLITFNRSHDEVLGDLIQRLLRARATRARALAASQKNDEQRDESNAAAVHAEKVYEDYFRQHEEMQQAKPLPKLTEEAERELQSLYRKSCSLCHPDKVAEEKKDVAHRVFVELQDAYKGSDLIRMREIHDTLKAGGVMRTRSNTLSEVEALRVAIAEIEHAIFKLVAELKALQDSSGARLMAAAGANETDWQRFFERKRRILESELHTVESDGFVTNDE